uniref:ATP synthase complex subunit 8 n=1 Tax=Impressosora ruficollis TaxID=904165 RepID=I7F2R5_9CUCU|nr:ATP synthase F0 subunit 8 [Impressosora ruficollis]
MPQMSPLSWLTLFILFTLALVIINILNFYTPILKKSPQPKMLKKMSTNWKW